VDATSNPSSFSSSPISSPSSSSTITSTQSELKLNNSNRKLKGNFSWSFFNNNENHTNNDSTAQQILQQSIIGAASISSNYQSNEASGSNLENLDSLISSADREFSLGLETNNFSIDNQIEAKKSITSNLIDKSQTKSLFQSSTSSATIANINGKLNVLKRSFNKKKTNSKIECGNFSDNNLNDSVSKTISPCSSSNWNFNRLVDKGNTRNSYFFNRLQQKIKNNQTDLQQTEPSPSSIKNDKERSLEYMINKSSNSVSLSENFMSFTNQSLNKPLTKICNKALSKEACNLFKLIQIYMGDREFKKEKLTNLQSLLACKTIGDSGFGGIGKRMLKNEENRRLLMDLICLEIMTKGWLFFQLRDELYLQIIKQTTANPNEKSLIYGLELLSIALSFFPPSQNLFQMLNDHICSYESILKGQQCQLENEGSSFMTPMPILDSSLLSVNNSDDNSFPVINKSENICQENLFELILKTSCKRLKKIQVSGAKKGLKKPTYEEITISRNTIFMPSLFGTSLQEIMEAQRNKFSGLSLPWIQTTLSEAILLLNGAKTEGIFRVPGDLDEVNNLKVKFDQIWCSQLLTMENNVNNNKKDITKVYKSSLELLQTVQDPHLPASLLKLWYRELYEPLIPYEFYEECIENCQNAEKCVSIIERLPEINRLVFTYLIRFLKVFAATENVAVTKMDANNLSMIMAPNCLRCKSRDPKVIIENTKKEMQFLKTLINNLDTSSIQGIY
jgi:hypothetical protein